MKYKIMVMLILELLMIQSCNVNHAGTTNKFRQESIDLIQQLEFAISTTPYCAMIQYTGKVVVDVIPVPDSYPANELAEEKHIYHARVLETYRGQKLENISFTLICEKGDGLINDKKPVIITLCVDNEGYFWPGVGSEFPATEKNIDAARRISRDIKMVEQSFPYCEWPE